MFHAEIRWLKNGPTLKMAGKLAGDWAGQARNLVTKDVVPKGLIVDLTDVSYIDSMGEELLKWLASLGAVFVAGNVYAVAICEQLRLLPLQVERHKHRHGSKQEKSSITPPRPIEAMCGGKEGEDLCRGFIGAQ